MTFVRFVARYKQDGYLFFERKMKLTFEQKLTTRTKKIHQSPHKSKSTKLCLMHPIIRCTIQCHHIIEIKKHAYRKNHGAETIGKQVL